ncbi:MAG: PadR family transcriptional regulator [Hornefia sp.]|nr:PadR family transcriptional regulator [Hornefia sp.]
MARGRSNFKMGTVEMLVLYLLSKRDMYGYELSLMIKELSEGDLIVMESSLYPILYKLQDKKYISDREESTGKRRIRVYYHLEKSGKDRLSDLLEDYRTTSQGIEKILSN